MDENPVDGSARGVEDRSNQDWTAGSECTGIGWWETGLEIRS
jgi:hypothetical protein